MAFEHKTNCGAVFRNQRQELDTHPDYQGDGLIDGRSYWISGWLKTGKNGGNKFMSLSFKPKDAQPKRSGRDL
jgi:hypothetical protein